MISEKTAERITGIFLIVIIILGYTWGQGYKYPDEMLESVIADVKTENIISKSLNTNNAENLDVAELRAKDKKGNIIPPYSTVVNNFTSNFPAKNEMLALNSHLLKKLNLREVYKSNGGIVLPNGYVAGVYPYTSTEYEAEQIEGLKLFLDSNQIQLLYVNKPTKYVDDSYLMTTMGISTYVNDNSNRFLEKLDLLDIKYLDLREQMSDPNSFDYFFRTDHHWTVPAGKLAAASISEKLNNEFGYNIDLSLYDDEAFTYKEYKEAWLGEQGKKIGTPFVGLDDYVSVIPNYPTSFNRLFNGRTITGTFDQVLVNQNVYLPENNQNPQDATSWHYSYLGNSGIIQNNNNPEGKKILVLGDSYDAVTNTFLALGASEVHGLVLRNFSGNLRDYIKNNNFDAVIISYAGFMIGAHDNENSANYRMFDFE